MELAFDAEAIMLLLFLIKSLDNVLGSMVGLRVKLKSFFV